jgi:mannitol/fructose-specific phosphotransferase system IIA component (Ntr-type)
MEDCDFQQREAALWLSPESLLLHTHKAFPPAPMALLATSAEGFQGMENGEKAKALVLLLGTPEESAEEHLRRLARIASLFHEKGILEGIIEAERYEDVLSHDS